MDARELRIGNWFKTNQEVFNHREQVASKIEAAGHINDYHESFCEPISLTEEWLLKFGFEKMEGITGRYAYQNGYFKFGDHCYLRHSGTNHPHYTVFTLNYDHETEEIVSTNLLYVHQLQNLYFSLTGDELELKKA